MYLKTVSNLFLETVELEVLKQSMDEKGFRMFLLDNSLEFGIIRNKKDNTFVNAKISAGTNTKTIKHNEIRAIDSNGELIYKKAADNILIPTVNTYYWVKITHKHDPTELGTVNIDANGNLTGTGTEFLSKLRGQPNFPSKIKLEGSSLNIGEYEVLEVIDDENVILQGDFTLEANLQYSIIGTFTPGYVIPSIDKNVFQYDGCTLSFIAESAVDEAPTAGFTAGIDFYIARVHTTSLGVVTIQDKRSNIWKTRAEFFADNVEEKENALIGIESIKFNHLFSTKAKNIVYLAYTFRTTSGNWHTNEGTNIISITSGIGGKFKTNNDFTDGDFDGWRLYREDGSYDRITSSINNGGTINLQLDRLVNTNYDANQTLLVTPDAEEIEVLFDSKSYLADLDVDTITWQSGTTVKYTFNNSPDLSKISVGDSFIFTSAAHDDNNGTYVITSVDDVTKYITITNGLRTDVSKDEGSDSPCVANPTQTELPLQRFLFPINKEIVKCEVLAYRDSISYYNVKYRYKHTDEYAGLHVLPSDTSNGFYNENQYDSEGNIVAMPTRTTYSADDDKGFIPINLNIASYHNFDLGDLGGVESLDITGLASPEDLVVGTNRQTQYITGTKVLTADFIINLNTTDAVNGNRFRLIFDGAVITLGGHDFLIKQGSTILKYLSETDINYMTLDRRQLVLDFIFDGTNWLLSIVEEDAAKVGDIKMKADLTDGTEFTFSTGLPITDEYVGWVLCDGQNGTRNLCKNFPVGADTLGGDTEYDIGDSGGEKEHTLTKAEVPKHSHVLNNGVDGAVFSNQDHNHTHNIENYNSSGGSTYRTEAKTNDGNYHQTHTGYQDTAHKHTGNTGDGTTDSLNGEAHENRPPFIALGFIQRVAL